MRKLKKQTSIVQYVSNRFTALFIVILLVVWAVIWALSNNAIRAEVRRDLSIGTKHGRHRMIETSNGWVPSPNFVFQDPDEHTTYVVLDSNSKLLFGSYPDGFQYDCPASQFRMRLIKSEKDQQKYYVYDTFKRKSGVYIRCVLAQKDVNSNYRFLQTCTLIFFPAVIIILFILRKLLEKQINEPVQNICQKVEGIGKGDSLSTRIDYQGNFKELSVFSDASDAMLDRVEKMLESQKQFTDNVAHELRTPIAVIMAQCDHLNGRNYSDEEQKKALEVLLRQSKKMNDMVLQMLKLSRLDQNRTKLYFEEVELGEILYSVCDEATYKSKKEVKLELNIHDEKAEVDIGLMTSLFQNLVGNAIKYGGDPALVRITAYETTSIVSIAITDNGPGIAESRIPAIMQRFYRGNGSDDIETEPDGFGLGLPLALTIAKKHDGDITVQSEIGVGSTFTVILPKKHISLT